ncbi:MAG: hypothetical protein R6X15_08120 [Pseudomonadota bacterium]
MHHFEKLPKWLITIAVLYFTVLFTFAVISGRQVTFWPPAIGKATGAESIPSENKHDSTPEPSQTELLERKIERQKAEIKRLTDELEKRESLLVPEEVISKFPLSLRGATLEETAANVAKLQHNISDIEGDFLFRLLRFHNDALCYGSSMNFTYPRKDDTASCVEKSKLAEQFVGFLAEIDFIDGEVIASPEQAKLYLTKYQEKKNFNTTGYYGIDVFKWLVIDYYEST